VRITGLTLTGRWVRLEPLTAKHRDALRTAADDARIWQHTLTVGRGPAFDEWFDEALSQGAAGTRVPFAVRRLQDSRLLGSTSYLDPSLTHRRVEIGSTWYVAEVWGTEVNPECKLLLMAHAFEALELNRVAFCTDLLNERSQAAIAKLGAVREGVCRADKITQGGRIRDSVVFSIIAPEWPGVKANLLARLQKGPTHAG
jgi:RimJ/RimL family protein N-acetyltransferase